MGDRTDILKVAASQIGYKEGANNDNKFGRWYGMNNQPWCAMFISWLAGQVGIPNKIIPKTAWVPDYQSYYESKGRYKAKGTYLPSSGDIILYGTNSHVGIVESCDAKTVTAIEGNTSAGGNNSNGDGVYRRTRALNNSWIRGYCLPEYEEDKEMEIRDLAIKDQSTGKSITVKAGLQDNQNYILLRDVEKIAPVKVGWDEASRAPTVEVKEGYSNKEIIGLLEGVIKELKQ